MPLYSAEQNFLVSLTFCYHSGFLCNLCFLLGISIFLSTYYVPVCKLSVSHILSIICSSPIDINIHFFMRKQVLFYEKLSHLLKSKMAEFESRPLHLLLSKFSHLPSLFFSVFYSITTCFN